MTKWKYQRLFEILPGLLAWVVIITPFLLAFFSPKILSIGLLLYITFWLVRTIFMSCRMVIGYNLYRRDIKINWLEKVKLIDGWRDIYHVVIVPTYKEEIAILETSIESVLLSNYPLDHVIYVLATEERDIERATEYSKLLKQKYQNKLYDYVAIMHPKDIPEEIIGKGPNIVYAGKKMDEYIKLRGISPARVLVTTMDSDNLPDKQYLACLTNKYLTDPDRVHKSFQPIPMFFNNIWDVPMAMRLIAMGSSFWQLIVSTRPSRLRNFSAHAQSLEALELVDFWSTNSIVEDGHQFWRSYFKFKGNHHVVPMFTPIYQDAVLAGGMSQTIKEQYLQKRRWSWGVSDIPFVMEHTIGNHDIPWFDRWANAIILWESHLSWATLSIILATSAWLPLLVNAGFKSSVMAYQFPIVYKWLLYIAYIGMITTLILSTLMVPPKKGKKPIFRIALDWILTPIVMPLSNIFFSAIPALHSQTALMFGKYLEYRVTIKSIKRSNT